MARGDLYSEHPEWFRETISKTVVPYERQPQWKSLDARRFVEEGIEGQPLPRNSDLYREHPEWFRDAGDTPYAPVRTEPLPKAEIWNKEVVGRKVARKVSEYVDQGTEGQKGWDAPEPSWKDEPDSDYRLHPAGRFVGSTVAGGNPKHWEPDRDPDTRTKGSTGEFHAGHV